MSTVAQLLQPVESDLEQLLSDLRALVAPVTPFFRRQLSISSVPAVALTARNCLVAEPGPGSRW